MSTAKTPTRRQLATKLLEVIPVLNTNSTGMEAFHARLTALEEWKAIETGLTFWQRLRRVVGW